MKTRLIRVAALASAALLAGCDGQPAAPSFDLSAATTASIAVRVQTDISSTATPNFVNDAAGGSRVNLYKQGDTTLVASFTTPGATTPTVDKGKIRFFGLPPGTYVMRTSLRKYSTTSATSSFSPQLGDSIVLAVAAGALDTTGVFRVRLGASWAAALTIQWTDSVAFNKTIRLAGTKIVFQRETAPASGVYTNFDSVTTDATGAFAMPLRVDGTPGPGSVTTRIRATWTTNTAGLSSAPPDVATFLLGGFGTLATNPTVNPGLNATTTFFQAGTAGAIPNQNITTALTYTLPSQIQGRVFKDANGNGVYDAGGIGALAEELAIGDTVRVQLRNTDALTAATSRVLTSANVIGTGAALNYTFSGLRQGNYRLSMDLLTSRINGVRATVSPSIPVNLASSAARYATAPATPATPNPVDFKATPVP